MLYQHSFHVEVTPHERDSPRNHAPVRVKNGVNGLMNHLLIKPKSGNMTRIKKSVKH
jgi:hypothetical protein